MTAQLITASDRYYRFNADGPARRAEFPQSVLRVRVVDEITGRGVEAPLSVSEQSDGLCPRIGPDGLIGLVGRPAPTFGAFLPAALTMRVDAAGYVPAEVSQVVGAQPDYPEEFDELIAPEQGLHRQPVSFVGRVVARLNPAPPLPVAGALVEVTGYWATFADVEALLPAAAANIVSLDYPLSLSRAAGPGTVQRELPALAGSPKTLVTPTSERDERIRLSNAQGLAVGNVLAIEHDDDARTEYVAIAQIEAVPTATQAAELTLDLPLELAHRDGAPVRRVSFGAAGPVNGFDRDAIAGDRCLFLAGSAGFADDMVVSVSGGGATEYRRARRMRTVSDGDGYFRLPPISRAAIVEITGTAGALDPTVQRHRPIYGQADNTIEVTFR